MNNYTSYNVYSEKMDVVEIPHEAKFLFEIWMKEFKMLKTGEPDNPDNPRKAMEFALEDLE